MRPAVFHRLDALPQSPKRKLDRKVLPTVDALASTGRPSAGAPTRGARWIWHRDRCCVRVGDLESRASGCSSPHTISWWTRRPGKSFSCICTGYSLTFAPEVNRRCRARPVPDRQWAQRLTEFARSPAATDELAYWERTITPAPPIPADHVAASNPAGSARCVTAARWRPLPRATRCGCRFPAPPLSPPHAKRSPRRSSMPQGGVGFDALRCLSRHTPR